MILESTKYDTVKYEIVEYEIVELASAKCEMIRLEVWDIGVGIVRSRKLWSRKVRKSEVGNT